MAQTPRKKRTPRTPPKVNPRPTDLGHPRGKPGLLDTNTFILICERYAETGQAIRSCEDLGVEYNTVKSAVVDADKRGDPSWRERWEFSREKFKESLEAAVIQRGRDGTPTKWRVDPKTGAREVIEREYSDRMLELAAKAYMPERFRDYQGAAGDVEMKRTDAFDGLTLKAKREIYAIVTRDLEEQRQAKIAAGEVIDAEYVAIEDQRDA